ncbi:hypothetical protein [Kribbella deserti]|uniref:Homing endonuclease LAGLIDADG domain-containing protein n=1 Tax=Kribbella deserti TaxID=1926257 RepID=A0ABV6QGY8_9ACTN
MTPEQAAWLAGLLDGEGCFDAPRNNPRIRVKMSDHDVIIRAADLMDASTHLEPPGRNGYKPLMVAQITGARAVAVMRAVLPLLSARRTAKATSLITAYAARPASRPRHLRSAA